ncbi:MAG: hypothetical protein N3D73_01080 [Candidatus Diapherotrites archaeon]|nr:hypothetical protein [Candidatus Diapherotrites archaeon]
MPLNFDDIRKIHKFETTSSKLSVLPDNFYNELRDFVKKQQDLSSKSNLMYDKTKDLQIIKQVLEEIFSARKKKIINIALARSNKEEEFIPQLPWHEKKLYDNIIRELDFYNRVLNEMFNLNNKEGQKDLNIVYVKILSDIPSFIGADMKTYGPFKKDQEISLPYEIAKLLIKKNVAKMI